MRNKGVINVEMQIKYDELEIIRRVYDEGVYEINICRSLKGDESLYTVICLKEIELFQEQIKFFSELREKKNFNDFVTCFSKNSYIYILFIYHEEVPLIFKELINKSVKEKADFIKAILSYVVVSDIPEIMLHDLLSKENINVDKSGQAYFNYFLKRIEKYDINNQKRYMKKLSNIIMGIFNEEIIDNRLQGMNIIIDKLQSQSYISVMDIYMDFISLYDEFNLCMDSEDDKEISFISKIKNNLKRIYKKWGLTIITAILSVAVVVLIVTCTAERKPENVTKIDSIGTREIK